MEGWLLQHGASLAASSNLKLPNLEHTFVFDDDYLACFPPTYFGSM